MLKKGCILLALLFCLPLATLTACKKRKTETEYVMQLEYLPEEEKLVGQTTVTYCNQTENSFRELKFYLWANAYRNGAKYPPVSELYRPAVYYDGESYGKIELLSVEGGKGFSVTGEDETILSVPLQNELYPDESVTLTMRYEVSLPHANHRLGIGEHAVNLTHFYPVLCPVGSGFPEYVYAPYGDPFVAECANYSVLLTLPESYVAAFGGRGEEQTAGGKRHYAVKAEGVRDIAFVLYPECEILREEAGGVSVEYYYLSDPSPEETLSIAAASLSTYGEAFGKYPYPKYVLAQTDFPYGGMEYSGLALLSLSVREKEKPYVVAHETAHQWWYALVGSNQYAESWQDEGLAEFSVAYFFGQNPAYGGSYADMVASSEKSYRAFYTVATQLDGAADTRMSRPLTAFSGEYEYRNIAYDKGLILFARLRDLLGDRKFFAGLRRYVKEYGGCIATPAELISCFDGGKAEGVVLSFVEGRCVI